MSKVTYIRFDELSIDATPDGYLRLTQNTDGHDDVILIPMNYVKDVVRDMTEIAEGF